ncbi:MAG: class I SAM-dependent methyltransferase [Burkholderiaceae bacterium]|jgi:SAM-dependent methyltransferase|nr:class I SAM-dependent methyltransferase [Burkholderiaceae bacterium]MCU0964381.1 class I SAM-dependent methyltransferase [Burkholderiaceae bacterium]
MSASASGSPADVSPHSLLGAPSRVLRAVASNQLARFAPRLYVRLTGQTGRGAAAEEAPADIAKYFRDCVDAYFERLRIAPADAPAFLAGKTLMEYGPGDLPGVAALMVARGARKVYCVDRFPLVHLSPKNARVVADLIEACRGPERDRLVACLANADDPAAGFASDRIEYLVRPSGLSGLRDTVDLVFSRAVLEHVDDLDATFDDMMAALRPGGLAIHQVDLRSHGLHMTNPLDFLAWSPTLWQWMYSQKGVPNRWRIDKYRSILQRQPADVLELQPTKLAAQEHVAAVRPALAPAFQPLSDEDLSWLGFWLVMRKQRG